MKILILANKMPYPPRDGGSIATLSLATSLAKLGADVTLLAMNTSKHYFAVDQIPENLRSLIRFEDVYIDTTIRVFDALRNYTTSSIPYNAERFISAAFNQKLTELLLANDFDVVQLEGLYVGPFIRTIRKFTHALVSMRPHNVEHEIWERTALLGSGLKRFYLKNLARRIKRFEVSMLNNYDVLVPITNRDAQVFRGLGCSIPIHVTPTGIESIDYLPNPESMEFPSVFHLGALDWAPNQESLKWFLNKVWPLVLKNHPDLKFFLAGRNAPQWIRQLQVRNLVFVGEVENARSFINSKAVMVVPLLSGSGLRIKIIEGMALGKAIVTTSIGNEGIDSTHKQNIMIADTPEEFAHAIGYFLSDRNRVLEFGSRAREFVCKHYDNKVITSSLLDFYHKFSE